MYNFRQLVNTPCCCYAPDLVCVNTTYRLRGLARSSGEVHPTYDTVLSLAAHDTTRAHG